MLSYGCHAIRQHNAGQTATARERRIREGRQAIRQHNGSQAGTVAKHRADFCHGIRHRKGASSSAGIQQHLGLICVEQNAIHRNIIFVAVFHIDPGQGVAHAECFLTQVGHAGGNGNALQTVAIKERIITDLGQTLRKIDALQTVAVGKRIITDAGYLGGHGDRLQIAATFEGICADISQRVGQIDALQVVAISKRAIPQVGQVGRHPDRLQTVAGIKCRVFNPCYAVRNCNAGHIGVGIMGTEGIVANLGHRQTLDGVRNDHIRCFTGVTGDHHIVTVVIGVNFILQSVRRGLRTDIQRYCKTQQQYQNQQASQKVFSVLSHRRTSSIVLGMQNRIASIFMLIIIPQLAEFARLCEKGPPFGGP